LCPWHEDTKPSLQINPARQSWKCWVCNDGGDIFSFAMKREGIDFREALEMLADRAGVVLQATPATPRPTAGSPGDKKTLYAACEWAEQQFAQCLQRSSDAEVARKYFADRKVNAESSQRFHLGFSPDSWQWLLDRARSTPFSPAVLEAAGLLAKSPKSGRFYDRFKGRVIFPIRDPQNRAIGFGGR
ncbi:MAG: DNA primase, partial [Planctomycetia bacterium]|nr:DNA primase [Planctomycetia bacterium]